jgi:type IV pilus assembly protein PilM
MAETRGVWGIDIGLAGLKAIRLVYAEGAKQVLATAFDFVPHPKILSQPDANPEELIGQALDTFLSRNKLEGDAVAIGVPGQTALARFIQLPPVESSKVAEIVKYEAKQQIPFALEEVIWDYQPLSVGMEESGFMLDAEVGLFAMKRDQVQQHLAPFVARKVEVDLIQIGPLALYNYLCHDRLGQVPGDKNPEPQEDYTLLLDMGADNTTLLVSNGKKIWNRNVPLGGNHFTRALTKEMKLTFAKAEHLKCNATKSPDPKAVFQALRPVFNDYVAEIQRSIGFFSSVNRDAKIARIVGVGNGFKLAGLQKFLQQNLQMDVERVDSFQALAGDAVLNAPMFQENLLSFAISYGLALQGLKITRVHTSLLPPEIKTARMIRKKKPWAVVTAAILLFSLALSTISYARVFNVVSVDRFGAAETKANGVIDNKTQMKSAYDKGKSDNAAARKELEDLTSFGQKRTPWLEVLKAINACLPRDVTEEELAEEDPTRRNRIRILSITAKEYPDVGEWFKSVPAENKQDYLREDDKEAKYAPKGPGYVFTLQGRHFHEDADNYMMREVPYVANTFLHNLKQWEVPELNPADRGATPTIVPVRKMGITHPLIVASLPTKKVEYYKNGPAAAAATGGGGADPGNSLGGRGGGLGGIGGPPGMIGGAGMGGAPGMGGMLGQRGRKSGGKKSTKAKADNAAVGMEDMQPIPLTDFTIQFVWRETPESKRLAEDAYMVEQAKKAGAAGGTNPAGGNAGGAPLTNTNAPQNTGGIPGGTPGGPQTGGNPGLAPAGAGQPGGNAGTPGTPPAGPAGAQPGGAQPSGAQRPN